MTKLRNEVAEMSEDLVIAFERVSDDVVSVMDSIQMLNKRTDRIAKAVTGLLKDQKRYTKVGPKTGNTYMTLNGRVHAIAEHLGITFEATPKQVIPAKIDVVKAPIKKGKK